MIRRLLVAVDDSPDALAAARLAVELASSLQAELQAVHVLADHGLDAALDAGAELAGVGPAALRRDRSAAAVLARVSAAAATAGVGVRTQLLTGRVGPALLRVARDWPADLLVIGSSGRAGSGTGYVGAMTRHMLEFAEQPVLVVSTAHRR